MPPGASDCSFLLAMVSSVLPSMPSPSLSLVTKKRRKGTDWPGIEKIVIGKGVTYFHMVCFSLKNIYIYDAFQAISTRLARIVILNCFNSLHTEGGFAATAWPVMAFKARPQIRVELAATAPRLP